MSEYRYLPALDTARGWAIFVVFLQHFGLIGFGWFSVQLFFCISGYLITGILVRERGRDSRSFFYRFYVRRTLRIFPLYYGFLLLVALVFFVTGAPSSFEHFWPYLTTYTFNVRALFGETRIVELPHNVFFHLWSLSVEEQFYLLWPWVVFFMSRRLLPYFLASLILIAPGIRHLSANWLLSNGWDSEQVRVFIYYFTPCQLDALASGALLATLPQLSKRTAATILLSSLTVFTLMGGISSYSLGIHAPVALGFPEHPWHGAQYIWGYSVVNFVAVGIVALCTTIHDAPRGIVGRIMNRMGKVSYGMYVYHAVFLIPFIGWQIDEPFDIFRVGGLFALYLATVWGIAEISYRYFEEPFLRLKSKFR